MPEKKERVQFDLDHKDLETLDQMKEKTNSATRAEVVRKALDVYDEWFLEMGPEDTIQVHDGETLVAKFKAKLLGR